MKALAARLLVMAITDPSARTGTLEATTAALRAGVPAVQLRWKNAPARAVLALAEEVRAATRNAGALLIINDRVDIALAVGADGAHLGDDDLPLTEARRIVPKGFLLGRSVDNADEAAAAESEGADYVGLGPVFRTSSKAGLGEALGVVGITAATQRVRIPVVAIGGIDQRRTAEAVRAGAAGVAAIAAIMNAEDPESAAAELLIEARQGVRSR